MIINAVKIRPRTGYKINRKHGVRFKEIRDILLSTLNPLYAQRVREDKYMAIGLGMRYLTIIFKYNIKFKEAIIKTAYPSKDWQIRLYRRKIGK